MKHVLIVGGGASGMAAAIAAARSGAQVTVLEHKAAVLNKLRLSGNGKCNFSNIYIDTECYHQGRQEAGSFGEGGADRSPQSDIIRLESLLREFGTEEIVEFMASIGIKSKVRYGGLYPESMRASDVAGALIAEAQRLDVRIRTDVLDEETDRSIGIYPGNSTRNASLYDEVILAAGGCSYTKTGSDGSGYRILRRLGIRYSRVLPALCPAFPDIDGMTGEFLEKHAGLRIIATARLYDSENSCVKEILTDNGGYAAEYTGEIQINEHSLSGIPILNLGRYISRITDENRSAGLLIDFLPDPDKVPEFLRERMGRPVPGCDSFFFKISRTGSFKHAQAVTGGVGLSFLDDDLKFFDADMDRDRNMGIRPYIVGELCDVDGICGGYNLHWAFLSGIRAGQAAAGIR